MDKFLKTQLYNSFYQDFIADKKITHNYLPRYKPNAWKLISQKVSSGSTTHKQVKEFIIKDNSDISSSNAQKNLNLLHSDSTVFIVTGQQLGLLASPLYTIYKIITAIKLADFLNDLKCGYNYVPLFWLESEDHDFDEINHFGVWDAQINPKLIQYNGESRGKTSIRHYTFDENINLVFKELRGSIIDTEFSNELFNKIEDFFKPGKTWLDATRDFLKDIFYETGLLFFKPGHEEIKSVSSQFYHDILEKRFELQDSFEDKSNSLENAGYNNQVTVIPGKSFLFIENDNLQREHLFYDQNGFYFTDEKQRLNFDQINQIINESPQKISSSVVSRPLLQSWLIPTAAYVAGPGEIAYWAQISGLFDIMRLTLPVVYPRITATIIEPKIDRFIKKHNITVENISANLNDFINNFIKTSEEDEFDKIRKGIEAELVNIKQKVLEVDSTLESIWEKTKERILGQIDVMENKTIKAKKQKEQILISQLTQVHKAFFPDDYPQERYVSLIYFLNKFGPDIFKKIYENLKFDCFQHQLIKI